MKNSENTDIKLMSQTAMLNFLLFLIMLGATTWLAGTTSFSLYSIISNSLQNMNGGLFLIGVAGVVGLGYIIIDMGNGLLFQFYFFKKETMDDDQQKNEHYQQYLSFIIKLIIVRMAVSFAITFFVTPEAATFTTKESRHDDYLAQLDTLQGKKAQQLAVLRDDKLALEKSEKARVKSATRKGNALKQKAINAGSIYQIKSYKEQGFQWIESTHTNNTRANRKYAKSIRKAMAKKEELILAEKNRTQSTASLYENSQGADSLFTAQAATLLSSANEEKTTYKATVNRRTNIFYIIDFICLLIVPFCGYMIVKRSLAANYQPSDKSLIYVLATAFENKYEYWLGKLETYLSVDLDGNGNIGTIGTKNFKTKKTPTATFPIQPKQDSETTETESPKQPKQDSETDSAKQLESLVQQELQTVYKIVDEKDLRSQCKQKYKRSKRETNKSKNPSETTLRNNFIKFLAFKKRLEELGYIVTETTDDLDKPDLTLTPPKA